ncbi:hypothetical protein SH449x_003304 [Pirellulaceae bacterium SH449]
MPELVNQWDSYVRTLNLNLAGQSLGLLAVTSCLGFVSVLFVSLLRRLIAGAQFQELLANGCYEWIPGRGMLYVIYGILWIIQSWGMALVVFTVIGLFAAFDPERKTALLPAVSFLALAIAWFVLARWVRLKFDRRFISVDSFTLPIVDVNVRAITALRDAGDTSKIGTERFPNQASPYFSLGIIARQWIRFVGILGCVTQLFISLQFSSKNPVESELARYAVRTAEYCRYEYHGFIQLVRDFAIPKPVAAVVSYFSLAMLWILLNNNRQYLLVRFPTVLLMTLLLSMLFWVGIASLGEIDGHNLDIVYGATYVILFLVFSRMHTDLRRAKNYKRRKQFLTPVSNAIAREVGSFLKDVQKDDVCRLPDLNSESLSSRITRGARNIEEGDAYVTRFFGRYMRVAKVATERCTTASLRFLTINRYTECGNCWPSYAPIGDPQVPVWNEALFPIHAPKGFVNHRDSLRLSEQWNPVVYCPPTEQRQETYTERETYSDWDSSSNSYVTRSRDVQRTRYITVTCSRCNGVGRLEYERFLVTKWTTTRPTIVSPTMQLPELVENAEEAFYYQLPIVDGGRILQDRSLMVDAGAALAQKMERAGQKLSARVKEFSDLVVRCNQDAYVYRADFVIGGLHAMNIRFHFLQSRTGWFFGNRPEFHFPKLPIGWATIGTWVFLPPIAILIWLCILIGPIYLLSFLVGRT